MRFWHSFVSAAPFMAMTISMAAGQPGWHDHYAKVNGVKLHYVVQGKGPLIVFLHGFPEFWYAWKDLLPEFARDHRALALDMRGYNLSDQPVVVDAYKVPVLVEDIRALAVKLHAKRFVLVGHDWGGVVAWAFAAAHPEMLDRLIIVNAPSSHRFRPRIGEQSGATEGQFLFPPVRISQGRGDHRRERLRVIS